MQDFFFEFLLPLFLYGLPICGLICLIIGLWTLGRNARLPDDTPKKSLVILKMGLALLALAIAGWVIFLAAFAAAGGGVTV